MNRAIEKLAKFLQLEAERGYDNKAVVGGLHNILDTWQTEAVEAGVQQETIDAVVARLVDYPKLSSNSRTETLRGLWNRLVNEYPEIRRFQPKTAEPLLVAESPDRPRAGSPQPAEEIPPGKPRAQEQVPQDRREPIQASETREAPQPEPAALTPMEPPAALGAPLTTVPGIGPKSAKTLKKLELETLGDLLWHLPRRYDDYSQLKTINRLWYGEDVTIIGTIEEVNLRPIRGGKLKLVEAIIGDGTGLLRITWFNQAWIANRLKPGRAVVLSGRVDQYLGKLTMSNPDWEALERQQLHTNRIVPVYPLTAGVTAKWLRRVINSVVGRLAPRVPDPLPASVRTSAGLVDLATALQQVHFPDSWERLKQAQERLAFEEMFLLQLGVLRQKSTWMDLETRPLPVDETWLERFRAGLPYRLTPDQEKALADLQHDLASASPMNRLLQGDVGSGKTVVAAAGIGICAANRAQAALMAPTSILAEQHYLTMLDLLPNACGIPEDRIRLLIGATPDQEKAQIRDQLLSGELSLLVGTHALLEEPVEFKELGLAIIDEQHRFGVEQRATLRAKGTNPNLIVMTATPIPRSLALTVYGDLDLSLIEELPPGRKEIETRVLLPTERSRAYQFLESQLEAGRQAFIIYPLVEGSEKVQAKAAVDEHDRLQKEVFLKWRLGLLHGRLKPAEKEQVMAQFRAGEYDILVSTSVVEVGVDISNAALMLIEGADRFGLAQLHQFRGRVGRGEHQSYCLLIPESDDAADNERLKAMEATNDGFKLAELDLDQRGPGDFLGTRQSGYIDLKAAQLTDVKLIEKARREAAKLFEMDPLLQDPLHHLLSEAVERFWTAGEGEIS